MIILTVIVWHYKFFRSKTSTLVGYLGAIMHMYMHVGVSVGQLFTSLTGQIGVSSPFTVHYGWPLHWAVRVWL